MARLDPGRLFASRRSILRKLFGVSALVLLAGSLGGCSLVRDGVSLSKGNVGTQEDAASALVLEDLGPQKLAQGSCALFLWQRVQTKPMIFFARLNESEGRVRYQGKVVTLHFAEGSALDATDDVTSLHFVAEGAPFSGELTLALRAMPQNKTIGAEGLLRLTGDDGWSAALPVAGMIGCQTDKP